MQKIYLDNAAATPLSKEVLSVMLESLQNNIGNPSSIHSFGRSVRAKIEMARKNIANAIKAQSSEIIFTSGGTEANNMVFNCAVKDLQIKRIITCKTEHSAVLNPVFKLPQGVEFEYVDISDCGIINLAHLEKLLSQSEKKTLVSIMHINNETGLISPISVINEICKRNKALFHSDTVQSIAYFDFNLKEIDIDFVTCSGHKFHGPKGIGFLYVNQKHIITPFINGGSQEKGLRGGTENVSSILGMEKALLTIKADLPEIIKHLQYLKSELLFQLKSEGLEYKINGDEFNSSPAIINISFKTEKDVSMLLFNLDLEGIAISGGSACTSGSNKGSHVLKAMGVSMNNPAIRISFSKYNTAFDINRLVTVLKKLLTKKV
ncbi:MAG: cysteine desulfurase family protein [Flavobacteriales bacterium]|nr:cysteine desulfurase family protein [Flavobacteriales bacterium]